MLFRVECFSGWIGGEEHRLFECHYDAWVSILDLAEKFGWQPQGTELDEDSLKSLKETASKANRPFNLDWFKPDYKPYQWDSIKIVNKEDAQNLRDALEKAIQNKVLTAPKKRPMIINEEATQAEHTRINQQTSEKLIKEFIEFLNWGKFGFCFDD